MNGENELPDNVKKFLLAEYENHHEREGDISVMAAAKLWDCSPSVARDRLKKMAEEGKLIELKGSLLSGGRGFFFRLPD